MGNRGLSGISLKKHRELYAEWRAMNASGKSPLDLGMPWITLVARDYLMGYFRQRPVADTRVFEYGSGGSSAFFMNYASEVISVEHDKAWADKVQQWAASRQISGWLLKHIPPELSGEPVSRRDESDPRLYQSQGDQFEGYSFKQYVSFIDQYPDRYFDVVLVDGRSRPSCLLHATPKVKQGGLLVLDNAEREYYLTKKEFSSNEFALVSSSWGALIGTPQFTRTNIYLRK